MIALAAAGALLPMLSGCQAPAPATEEQPLPVEVVSPSAEARNGGMVATRHPAVFVREREADLSFRVGGTVVQAAARAGDRLGRGAPVALIDDTPYAAAAARARTEVARLERANARNRLLLEAGAIASAEAGDGRDALAAARATLAQAQYDLASTRLRMPFGGVVLQRDVEVGNVMAPGARAVRVADEGSALLARASIPGNAARRLRRGDAMVVRPSGEATEIAGIVRRIGAASDRTTASVAVDIAIPPGAAVSLGGTASAYRRATAPSPASAQALPLEALIDAANGYGHVFLVAGRPPVARRARVAIVGVADERVMVSGLPDGARVITAGAGFVSEGQRVVVARR